MDSREYLGKELYIKIDRPLGSIHPKYDYIYLVNYEYVPDTISGGGEELDAYLLGVFEPVIEAKGKVIAILHRTNDDILILSGNEKNYTNEQIDALTEFQEKYFEHVYIR